jgi:hypothetical protein
MQTPLDLKWDEFDRRISETLAAWGRDVQPPDWVWQRIAHKVIALNRMGDYAGYSEDESPVSSEFVGLVT